MTDYTQAWAIAFVLTLLLEAPVYTFAIEKPRARAFLIGASASCITHPLLWFVVTPIVPWGSAGMWAAVEVGVTMCEAAWLWLWGVRDRRVGAVVAIALAANATSAVLGEGLRRIFPYF